MEVKPTERLKKVLSAFYYLQILRLKDLAKVALFSSESSLRVYIFKLKKRRLIQSKALPISDGGRPENIYFLTKKGASLATGLLGFSFSSRTTLPPLKFMFHHLKQVEIILIAKQNIEGLSILADFNYRLNEKKQAVKILKIPLDEKHFLIPDLRIKKGSKIIYLEVDMSSESLSEIKEKLSKYVFFKSNSFDDFRLIFVVLDEARKKEILSINLPDWCFVTTETCFIGELRKTIN